MISMILYHTVWDLVYLYGKEWAWYEGTAAALWQHSICCTFIALAGFCHSFGRHPLRQGLIVSGAGFLVTAVTEVFMPGSRVMFGVLNLIGASALLLFFGKASLEKLPSGIGLLGSLALFIVTYAVQDGYAGILGWKLIRLPEGLYRNLLTTFVGFPYRGFFSSDYFPLLPWSFLYMAGYFLHRIWTAHDRPTVRWMEQKIPVLTWMGQHSLLIYLLHQPVIYGILELSKK